MTNDAKLQQTVSAEKSKRRRKSVSLDRKKARAGWFFVLPFVIGFLLIYLPIIVESFWTTFHHMERMESGALVIGEWVGLDNYKYAFMGDASFSQILIQGLQKLAFDIPAILIFSLFMAVLLNQKMMGRAAFRAIFFLPVVAATGAMEVINAADIQQQLASSSIDSGSGENATNSIVSAIDIEKLFSTMKIGTELVDLVVDLINNIYDIVNRSGVQMLIFLAGLQSISPAIYEACRIDGATAWETFWKITFPMISPMILVNAVYTIIDSFTINTNPVMQYVGVMVSDGKKAAQLTTMAWIYFLIVILVIAVVAAIFSAFVFYQRRD